MEFSSKETQTLAPPNLMIGKNPVPKIAESIPSLVGI
jgi:hypothetical protein